MTADDKAFDVIQSDAALPPDLAQYAREMQQRIAATLARRPAAVYRCAGGCDAVVSAPDAWCLSCASASEEPR